VSCVIIVSNIR